MSDIDRIRRILDLIAEERLTINLAVRAIVVQEGNIRRMLDRLASGATASTETCADCGKEAPVGHFMCIKCIAKGNPETSATPGEPAP